MIKLPFTPEMIAESKILANAMGGIRNSILKGGGNLAGILAELALAKYINGARVNLKNYDIKVDGVTVEAKAKRRTRDPLPHYEGSVALTSSHQKPDYYVFLSLTFSQKVGKNYTGLESIWLCGAISCDDFIKKSRILKKGEIDESNGFVVLTDMRNIKYSELKIWKSKRQ